MKSDWRFVFDTNVVVSALLFEQSVPGQAYYVALEEGEILLSLAVLKELNEVLSRRKFDHYVVRAEREGFLGALVQESRLVEVTETIRVCRDPKDDRFLELAVAGEATVLVSGDADLLDLVEFRGVPIKTPDDFLARLLKENKAS